MISNNLVTNLQNFHFRICYYLLLINYVISLLAFFNFYSSWLTCVYKSRMIWFFMLLDCIRVESEALSRSCLFCYCSFFTSPFSKSFCCWRTRMAVSLWDFKTLFSNSNWCVLCLLQVMACLTFSSRTAILS